jgi:fructose-1,6-bisphosphatase/inositol monophosphatase family enzyme
VVEEVSDAAAGAFGDLAAAFGDSDTSVFGSLADAFAEVFAGFGGVEGDEVGGSLADAFADVARGSACAFADVSGTAADISAGAAALRMRGGLGLGRRGVRLSVGSCAKSESDAAGEDECEK